VMSCLLITDIGLYTCAEIKIALENALTFPPLLT